MKNLPNCRGGAPLFMIIFLLFSTGLVERMHAGDMQLPPQATVSGSVSDVDGLPLPGVHIQVESTKAGTISDLDGYFSIQAGEEDVLVFSIVGFKRLEVPVMGSPHLDVSLEQDVTQLGEVVLNAGYYTVKERESTGSIEKITAVDIEKQPISNPLAALQGRVAGVEIQQTSGLPGANFNIRIRGQNSIRSDGNNPLYIINGVPFSSATLGEAQASISLPGMGVSPLNSINPSDIESIEILKDADATAIYGSRGANGVVLITTKKGKEGMAEVSLDIFTGLGTVTNTMDMLHTPQYIKIRQEAYTNDEIDLLPANAYDVNGTWSKTRYTDWQKELFGKTAYLSNVRGSISGGDARTQFLISGNYYSQTDNFPGKFKSDKISGLANLNHKTSDGKLSTQLSTSYSSEKNNLPNSVPLVLSGLLLAPNAPETYDKEGELNWENGTWQNPLRELESVYRSHATTFIGNSRLSYKVIPEVELIANLGFTESHLNEIKTFPSSIYNPSSGIGSDRSYVVHNIGKRISWIVEPQLIWAQNFGETSLQALVGMSFQEQSSKRLSLQARGFSNNSLIENIAAATFLSLYTDRDQEYRYNAIFGRLNFNHKGKYIINLTGRRDGSSRFGPSKRFSNFGAIGLAWLFAKESFFKNTLPFLNFGKIKGSFGSAGNDQIGDYQFLDTYSFGSSNYQNGYGLYPTRLYNPNFSWEQNQKLELSLELGLFNDRIFLSGNYYRNRSSNQLVGIPLPATTGFPSILGNLGATVENTGLELELITMNMTKKNFNWSTSINLTIPKNRLLSFPDLEGSTYANSLLIGKPLNIRKVYRLERVNPETGIYEFFDVNGDGEISSIDDKKVVMDLNPKYYGGLNNSLTIGGFKLDILFQFTKQSGWNFWRDVGIPGSQSNLPRNILERWQSEGDDSQYQRMSIGQTIDPLIGFFNFQESDAAISDASFIRLKTLSLSYDVLNKKNNGIGWELYARGQNLWTLTNYFGLDPETRNNQTIPTLRILSVGTIVKF